MSTTATAADALLQPTAVPVAVSATDLTRRYGEADTAVDASAASRWTSPTPASLFC
jgi:hypothetical protein